MPVYKDGNNGTFYVQCYYRDARGSKRHKTKRGFSSEVEAAVWEGQFKSLNGGAMDMTFSEFVEVYASEVKPRIREHTWITKEYIINDKLVPFFGDMRMCDVRPLSGRLRPSMPCSRAPRRPRRPSRLPRRRLQPRAVLAPGDYPARLPAGRWRSAPRPRRAPR